MAARTGFRFLYGPLQFFEGVAEELAAFARAVYSAPAGAPVEGAPPECVAHVWGWFQALSLTRGGTGYDALALQPSEIESWARQMRIIMTPWEFALLGRLDAAVLPILNKKSDAAPGVSSVDPRDGAAVSALFSGLKARAAAKFGKG